MRMRLRTLTIRSALLQGVALLASAVAPALASADRPLAQEHADTSVSAYGGRVVWSSWDEQTHRYRLTEYSGGGVHVLPVRGRVVPFDADVGLGARGNPVVLYSRCLQETEPNAIENGTFADYSAARGCHVFRYEFRSRRERKLRLPGPPGRSDFLPSQWRDRLAFVRVYGRRHGRAGRLP